MSERGNAVADVAELLAGLTQTALNVTSVQSELKRLKSQIGRLLQSNKGVLLVMRTETIRHILVTSSHFASLEIIGAGPQPEPIASQPRMYPKKHGHQQMSETFIWVLRNKDVKNFLHRPPGYYMTANDNIKYLPFENI